MPTRLRACLRRVRAKRTISSMIRRRENAGCRRRYRNK